MPLSPPPYTPASRFREMLADSDAVLPVLRRFGIAPAGLDDSADDMCARSGADCPTFLAVASLVAGCRTDGLVPAPRPLMAYLREAYAEILDCALPDVRRALVNSVGYPRLDDTSIRVIRLFDEYVDEVSCHVNYADRIVFPYVERLLDGTSSAYFRISDFASGHRPLRSKIDGLAEFFFATHPAPCTPALARALAGIAACAREVAAHCRMESVFLVPAVEAVERRSLPERDDCARSVAAGVPDSRITPREKEIINLVAHGLANKEIADRLSLSFHTVTTYRKNISAKLNIHSTAALTIYAILQNLVDPRSIKLR